MEIGAGGGSIAKVSKMGTLQVGPESANADPGPMCYDQGGMHPCVTDADLLLGYLNPDYFLGGEMQLNLKKATQGIKESIADPLNVSPIQATWGIHDLINETMAAAAKTHIAEKGGNPKVVTIVAFGGAGPVHAYGLAKKLGAPRLVIPPNAGVGSAMGFFTAPRAFDLVRSHKVTLNDADFHEIENLFKSMEEEGRKTILTTGGDGEVIFERSVDVRFVGQGSETNIEVPAKDFASISKDSIRGWYDDIYQKLFGRTYPDSPVEFINFKVRASLPSRLLTLQERDFSHNTLAGARKGSRPAYSEAAGDFVRYTVYDRYSLPANVSFQGPAIIEERESTVIVGEDASVSMDRYGFLWINLEGK
jgi:N-methylhydantoinase A/oxoprolinase/acetone carboxylase beta subunit